MQVGPRKYKRRSKLGNRKDTWCLVEKVFTVVSGQSDTESCEDEPMPTVDEQAVQSIMEEDRDVSPYNNIPDASPSRSPVQSYKIVNGKLVKNEPKSSSKQVSYGSKYSAVKSETVPKKNFVLKDGECTRTCSTVIYYSKTDAAAMDTSFGEETKENDIPADEHDDQISIEDMDLTNLKTEPVAEPPEFVAAHDYDICNMEYNNQGEVEYYIQDNGEFTVQQEELMLVEATNDGGLIETELVMFEQDFVEEVGANIELSTEELVPVYAETISCDICDELFEDRKELMRHIQTMHIG